MKTPESKQTSEYVMAAEIVELLHGPADENDSAYINDVAEVAAYLKGNVVHTMKTGTQPGTQLIAEERARQILEKNWTPEHDDKHDSSELAMAAASYAIPERFRVMRVRTIEVPTQRGLSDPESLAKVIVQIPTTWPWSHDWWKPSKDEVKNLVKAGALIAAEIDRLQRRTTP